MSASLISRPLRAGTAARPLVGTSARAAHAAPVAARGARLVTHAAAGGADPLTTVTEEKTGITFPLVQQFWDGEKMRNLGATVRAKKIAFISVKVYAIALFVEGERAAKELGVRERGGFFADDNDADFCDALMDGAFNKVLWVQLNRKVDGETFFGAIEEALTPRLSLTGEMMLLTDFKQYFEGKSFEKGTEVLLHWRMEGVLELLIRRVGEEDYTNATPDGRIASASFARALFEVYLGSNSVVPDGRAQWAQGARNLLESENVRRSTRKSGGG